jgi:hypothetical protein
VLEAGLLGRTVSDTVWFSVTARLPTATSSYTSGWFSTSTRSSNGHLDAATCVFDRPVGGLALDGSTLDGHLLTVDRHVDGPFLLDDVLPDGDMPSLALPLFRPKLLLAQLQPVLAPVQLGHYRLVTPTLSDLRHRGCSHER